MQEALDSFPLFRAANFTPDISNQSHNPHGWSWKQENRDLPNWRQQQYSLLLLHTHQTLCGCLCFQYIYPLSCPEKNGLDGWQGKSFLSQETSRMWVESPVYWVPAVPRSNCGALDANLCIPLPASTERRLRVKGRDYTIYLAIGFYFLQHFCKDFPFVNRGLH